MGHIAVLRLKEENKKKVVDSVIMGKMEKFNMFWNE